MTILKLISLNSYGAPISFNRSLRFKLIAEELIKLNPDIILLQEVFFKSDRDIIINYLVKGGWKVLPENPDTFSNGGLLTFIKNVEFNNYRFHRFVEQGPIRIFSLADRIAGKGFQSISIKIGVKYITLINAHLLCLYNNSSIYTAPYTSQLNQLSNYLKSLQNKTVILGGDLNDIPSSTLLYKLISAHNLHDQLSSEVFTISHHNTNRQGYIKYFLQQKSFRTDYLFISKNLKIKSQKVIFDNLYKTNNRSIHLSDHYGLLSVIKI